MKAPALVLLLLSACSPKTAALRAVVPLLDRGSTAFDAEPDPQLAREALPAQLKLLESLLESEPGNPRLRRLAAQGFGGYAFLFLEDSDPGRARQMYRRGLEHGLALLGRRQALRKLREAELSALESALRGLRPNDAPDLFWTAYNWGGWINLAKDSPEAVAELPKAVALMRRVQELSPGYYFGGPDLFLGAYYASRPRLLGGDLGKAKAHFDSAVAATGGRFLMAKLLYARYYAVAAQDSELFKRLNAEVEETPGVMPEARLADAVAKMKAKKLMEQIDELF